MGAIERRKTLKRKGNTVQDKNNLCWLDMEMTGLNPETDRIIEVAMIITDSDLNVLAQSEVYAVHQSDDVLLDTQLKNGESVLDYGCGSGILTIAALKLGAGFAVGVDIDEQAVRAGKDNAAQNNVDAQFFLPDGLPQGQFDVVVANILANPLRMLGEMLAARTKQGGRIVLSGLLDEQAEELGGIYSQWFDLDPAETEEGWARLSGVKR